MRESHLFILYNFNPRTRVECDQGTRLWWLDVSYFNPRTRVECDGGGGIDTLRFNFNPRTRVECDLDHNIQRLGYWPFQSTHSCRVRRGKENEWMGKIRISIHALV